MGSLSIVHWVIVLVIVMLVFGTKKLGNIGGDLGKAIKDFKDGVKDEEEHHAAKGSLKQDIDKTTINVDVKEKTKS
ncbi:MAG: Sec-independent protein translocase subunit TatA [Burkholderiaceae bacterium]